MKEFYFLVSSEYELFTQMSVFHVNDEIGDPCEHFVMHYVITHEILHGQEILPIEQNRLINGLVEMIIREKRMSNTGLTH